MKYLAKTYSQFINEAYVDSLGKLQDFEEPSESEYGIIEQAQRIQEFLEESSASEVQLDISDDIIRYKFVYADMNYRMKLNLESDTCLIEALPNSQNRVIRVYNNSAQSLFDLLASSGLEFLNDSF